MKCEVFDWTEPALNEVVHSVIHYYIDSELIVTNNVANEEI